MSSVSYTAVILDDKSRSILATAFKDLMPEGWEWIAHHMTICLGSLKDELRNDLLGSKIYLMVQSLGINDKVMAVGDSFGVIKFTPPGGDEIDIAIPRTEKIKKQIVVTLGQNDIFI